MQTRYRHARVAFAAALSLAALEVHAQAPGEPTPEQAAAQRESEPPADADASQQGAEPAADRRGAAPGSETQANSGLRLSQLIGTPVVDIEGTEIGEIEELMLSNAGTVDAVLAIGGIIGIGERLVLVPWKELEVSVADTEDRQYRVRLRKLTGEQLADSRPEFSFEPE